MDYPRVTEILRYFTGYEHVPTQILERAAARGTTVHAICAGLAKGAWIPDGMIDQELLGYVNSFREWEKETVQQFSIVEKRYFDDERKFCGQIDMVIKDKQGNSWLADLKTSRAPHKTHPVQMAAYQDLLNKHSIEVCGALLVYLNKDGTAPNIQKIEDLSEQKKVFDSALFCWNYFNKRKKNARNRNEERDDNDA
jgi:hypothetical protein